MTGWGIAGFGWIARDHVAPAIAASENGKLVATCDADDPLDEFLATPGLDAVYVAAPNDQHRPLVEAAAAAGKDVLCEKPMATSLADAEAMVTACARAGVRYATAFNQRWHGAHRALGELVAGGALGAVVQVRVLYACTAPAWWGEDDWHWDPARAGGGAAWDLAPHGLDLVPLLLGDPLVELRGLTQRRILTRAAVEDGAILTGRLASGVLLVLQVSYAWPEDLPRRVLEVTGTDGMARATDTMGQTAGGRLELLPGAERVPFADVDPFRAQVEAFAAGEAFPAAEHDLATMRWLESWR